MARFSREQLGRFWAIACRRREDQWGSPAVRSELLEMTREEALEWAQKRDPLGPPAAALAQSPAPPPPANPTPAPQPTAAVAIPVPAEATPGAPASALAEPLRWGRVSLLPGMDLVVREGASEIVVRLAREIVAKYGAS